MKDNVITSLTLIATGVLLLGQNAYAVPILPPPPPTSAPEPSPMIAVLVGSVLLAAVVAFKTYRNAQANKA